MSTPPTLEYGKSGPGRWTHVPTSVFLTVLGLGAALVWWTMTGLTSSPQAREKANQIKCDSNLRQIGMAVQLYAQDNHGLYPPDLQTLAATQQLALACFVCPSTDDTPAQKLSDLTLPDHESYIYVDAGLSNKSKSEGIIALEDPVHHGLQGAHVLFIDGFAQFFDLPTIQLLLNELNAGRNPPSTLTATLSQSAAEKDYQTNWKPRMPQLKSGVCHISTTQPATTPK